MSRTAESLLEQVLSLPEEERAAIADAIWDSLPHDEDRDDEAFAQELQRRSKEMDEDPSASISWSELKKVR